MQYVFHLGAHKTASGFLQGNLAANLDILRAQGVFYVNEEMPVALQRARKTVNRLYHPARAIPEPDALAAINSKITRRAEAAGATTVLISEPDLLGPSMHQALAWGIDNPGFYTQAPAALRLITSGLPAAHTRLLMFSRRPETYIVSLYSEAIRSAQLNLDLAAFCRAVNFNAIDFASLRDRLQAVDPALDLNMRAFERIKLGAETYLRTFLRDLGADPAAFVLTKTDPRPQLDANQVEALRQISMRGQSERWRLVKKLRDQVLSYAPDPAYPLELPSWVRDSLSVTSEGRRSGAA
ncbi:hypothetical protein [Roseovarius aestuariivivens]|uniref:hypothetical protein n=1 Tax=Roseovarius aestuariivivens TaxID=1888910 RepID=UPI001081A23E|nr:hypothetical protein [Roseovarius aestuariivivens]